MNIDPRLAFLAPIIMGWGMIRGWFIRLSLLFVRRVLLDEKTTSAVEAWLRKNARLVPMGSGFWRYQRMWAGDRFLNFVFDIGQQDGMFFVHRWHVLKFNRNQNLLIHSPFFNPAILLEELGWADSRLDGEVKEVEDNELGTGFRTQWVKGNRELSRRSLDNSVGGVPPAGAHASPEPVKSEDGYLAAVGSYSKPFWDLIPTKWGDCTKLGRSRDNVTTKDQHVLTPDLEAVVREFRAWALRREWCRERAVPWRRGTVLTGPPGGGKSTFVKYLAMRFNVPLYQFDLASMQNEDLEHAEDTMADGSIKIMLFEDIDAIWHGRECQLEATDRHRPVTFDRFLQFLGGINDRSGWYVVMTTNHPEHLDPAMVRDGRFETQVTVGPMTKDLQRRIAERILKGYPAEMEKALAELPEEEMVNKVESKFVKVAEEIFKNELNEIARGNVAAVVE